jgi:hypothetical protein
MRPITPPGAPTLDESRDRSHRGGFVSNFSIDKNALGRVINHAVQQKANDGQRLLDQLLVDCAGQPVDHVKQVLRSEWARAFDGGHITEPELTTWATALSDGQRIVVKTLPVEL